MLLLFPFWLVLFAILVGWGLLFTWALGRASAGKLRGALTTFQTLWLGYTALLAFLLLIAFFFPIGRMLIPFVVAGAIAGFALERRVVARRLRTWKLRPRVSSVIAGMIAIVSFVVAYVASDQIIAYDTNLYHLQVIKWNATYSAVPGLANLHLRFGYDNSVHLFDTFVDGFWEGMAAHVANGFLMTTVLAQWLVEIFSARTPRGRVRQVFCLLTLPFLLARLWQTEMASLSSDVPLALISYVLVLELASLRRTSVERLLPSIVLVLSLAAVAVTTKLGGLALFVVTAVFSLFLVGRRVDRRTWLCLFAPPALLLVMWVVRNIILSGWIIFPVFGRLPLSWSVPAELGLDNLRWIESWARIPAQTPEQVLDHGFLHWFLPWFDYFRQQRELVLAIASIVLLAWRIADPPASGSVHRAGFWTALVASFLGLVQWFIGAPDLRFGAFLFWIPPAVLFTSLAAGAMRERTVRAFVCVLALGACWWYGSLTPRMNERVPKLWGRLAPPPRIPTAFEETSPGTFVWRPWDGDQCADAEIPCTPERRGQGLRDPNSLGKGFYIPPKP